MASDYEKIKEENIVEYGQGKNHLKLLGKLYADSTHFIFELLQNAEDVSAKTIVFKLFRDRLEVLHDGTPFNEANVRGICGICVQGDKVEDYTKIGKFGIGFKSVYAFTKTPEIHSGDESFSIEYYVRPSAVQKKMVSKEMTTLFVFPFNADATEPEKTFQKIEERLQGLGARTILFLRSIKEIRYEISNGGSKFDTGHYLRESFGDSSDDTVRRVNIVGESSERLVTTNVEKWLIFQRPVILSGLNVEPVPNKQVYVEAAFLLETDKTTKKERISKVNDTPLVVFFPTNKETRFGLLIQGPYRTTPARDNIPEDDLWNKKLIAETSLLLADVLPKIRDRGLLTVSFLEALPIRMECFSKDGFFTPIAEKIRRELKTKELLPADDGTFLSADRLKLARVDALRELFNSIQLTKLFLSDDKLKWLIGGITADKLPDLHTYLQKELRIEEVDPDKIASKIDKYFLKEQNDKWMVEFYGFLCERSSLWKDKNGILRKKEIIRTQNDDMVQPFKSDLVTPNVYLPVGGESSYPTVKREIAEQEKAKDFLRRLGLSEPDIYVEIVNDILPKYANGKKVPPKTHHKHIAIILKAIHPNTDDPKGKKKVREVASNIPFIRAINSKGEIQFKKPTEVYLNIGKLKEYFANQESAWFLNETDFLSGEYNDAWCSLGVADLPRRISTPNGMPLVLREYSTKETTVTNYRLHGLEDFLKTAKSGVFEEQKERGLLLWTILSESLEANSTFFMGKYEWFYYGAHSKFFDSLILEALNGDKWVPTSNGTLAKPKDVTLRQLPPELLKIDGKELPKALGILEETFTEEQHKAHEIGIKDMAVFGYIKEHPDIVTEIIKKHMETSLSISTPALQETIEFPVNAVNNTERRRETVTQSVHGAPMKQYILQQQRVRASRPIGDHHTYLREQYRLTTGEIICQICKNTETKPFKKPDKNYYFEAVEIFTEKLFSKECHEMYLSLCPQCAAKYKVFIKCFEEKMEKLKKELTNANCTSQLTFSLQLDRETKIEFVESHLFDIQTCLVEQPGAE